jgi:DNA-binding Lrp family transcriptional regulator
VKPGDLGDELGYRESRGNKRCEVEDPRCHASPRIVMIERYDGLMPACLRISHRPRGRCARIFHIDATDRKILAILEAEGRLTVSALAERINLSAGACHRRLRELERTGAIRGYRAIIDPGAIGLGFEVLVHVTMEREDATTITAFEADLEVIPEVRHAERLFGDPDYLLRVNTADIAAYQNLRDERLSILPGVQRLTSTIVMKRIVENRPLPT